QELPTTIDFAFSDLPWDLYKGLLDGSNTPGTRLELLKGTAYITTYAKNETVQGAAREMLVKQSDMDDAPLRDVLVTIEQLPEEDRQRLIPDMIKEQFKQVRAQFATPTERTLERIALCNEYAQYLNPDDIPRLLSETLDLPQSAFTPWHAPLKRYLTGLPTDHARSIVDRAAHLITDAAQDQPKKQALLDIMLSSREQLDDATKETIHQRFFELLRHTDPTVRNTAVTMLNTVENGCPPQDFRLAINKA